MSHGVRIVEADTDWALAVRGRLLVTVWRTLATAARVGRVDAAIRAIVETGREPGYASITVVEPTISLLLDEEARRASTTLQTRWAERMKCSAYLVDGTGFLMATVRTVTSGMALVTRAPYPTKVFADVGSTVAWVSPFAGLGAPEVGGAIAAARAAR